MSLGKNLRLRPTPEPARTGGSTLLPQNFTVAGEIFGDNGDPIELAVLNIGNIVGDPISGVAEWDATTPDGGTLTLFYDAGTWKLSYTGIATAIPTLHTVTTASVDPTGLQMFDGQTTVVLIDQLGLGKPILGEIGKVGSNWYRWNGTSWESTAVGTSLLGSLRYDTSQSLSVSQKNQLSSNWPEAVASNLLLPAPYLIEDRSDWSIVFLYGQSLASGYAFRSPVTRGAVSPFVLAMRGNPKSPEVEWDAVAPLVENKNPTPDTLISSETGLARAGLGILKHASDEGGANDKYYLGHTLAVGSQSLVALSKGGAHYPKIPAFFGAAATLATAGGKTVDCPLMIFRQGEQDGGTTRLGWFNDLVTLRTDAMADATANLSRARDLRVVSYQTCRLGSPPDDEPTLAQWDLFRTHDWFTIGAPAYVAYGQGLDATLDDIHLRPAGYALLGAYEGRAAGKLLYNGKKYCTYPTAVEVAGEIVIVTYNVPVPPITIDEATIPAVQNAGFKLDDASGALTISNVRVWSDNQIAFDVHRAVVGSAVLRFGVDYDFAGSPLLGGIATNVRDSDPETIDLEYVEYNNAQYPLYNWSLCGDADCPADSVAQKFMDHVYVTNTDGVTAYADLKGASTITQLETAPTFDAEGMTIATDTALNTGIATGNIVSAWAVVYLDAARVLSDTAMIFNSKRGSFDAPGFYLVYGKNGGTNDHTFTLATENGGVHETQPVYIDDLFTGWVLVGVSIDETAQRRKIFVNPQVAKSGQYFDLNEAAWAGHINTDTIEIGKGGFTFTSGDESMKIALAGFSDQYIDTDREAVVIKDARSRLREVGITIDSL